MPLNTGGRKPATSLRLFPRVPLLGQRIFSTTDGFCPLGTQGRFTTLFRALSHSRTEKPQHGTSFSLATHPPTVYGHIYWISSIPIFHLLSRSLAKHEAIFPVVKPIPFETKKGQSTSEWTFGACGLGLYLLYLVSKGTRGLNHQSNPHKWKNRNNHVSKWTQPVRRVDFGAKPRSRRGPRCKSPP